RGAASGSHPKNLTLIEKTNPILASSLVQQGIAGSGHSIYISERRKKPAAQKQTKAAGRKPSGAARPQPLDGTGRLAPNKNRGRTEWHLMVVSIKSHWVCNYGGAFA